jgi:hypothetical protein
MGSKHLGCIVIGIVIGIVLSRMNLLGLGGKA